MKQISELVEKTKKVKRAKNISQEFQSYGVYIADQLGDSKHYSLYIKLAKTMERRHLDEALAFAKGYTTAKSKAKLFMWKLKQLRSESKS